tara:strand:- start:19 stop:492 length:474 start_codon:yes stop_codon:yes gene_type:complete
MKGVVAGEFERREKLGGRGQDDLQDRRGRSNDGSRLRRDEEEEGGFTSPALSQGELTEDYSTSSYIIPSEKVVHSASSAPGVKRKVWPLTAFFCAVPRVINMSLLFKFYSLPLSAQRRRRHRTQSDGYISIASLGKEGLNRQPKNMYILYIYIYIYI